jgi:hypothetical protein
MTRSIVIHGPQGCGKTKHADALARHFKLDLWIDGYSWSHEFPQNNCLVLTHEEPPLHLAQNPRVISFDQAMTLAGLKKSTPAPAPDDGATKLGDTIRLAMTIADYSARADIETFCRFERIACIHWYDLDTLKDGDALDQQFVANAVDYLHLRKKLRRHAVRSQLVTFLP